MDILCYDAAGDVHLVSPHELLFRRGGYIAFLLDDQLLVQRPSHESRWDLPGGGCERDEDPMEAAVRELMEETGLGEMIAEPEPLMAFEEYFYDSVTQAAWRSERHFFCVRARKAQFSGPYFPVSGDEPVAAVAQMIRRVVGATLFWSHTREGLENE